MDSLVELLLTASSKKNFGALPEYGTLSVVVIFVDFSSRFENKVHENQVRHWPDPYDWTQYPISVPKVDIILNPFARTQMLGPKFLDVNTVTNVHVSTKLMIGTSEHSFKSVDEGR